MLFPSMLVLLVASLLMATMASAETAGRSIIMIDAGSSGSRVHVHEYTTDNAQAGVPRIKPSQTTKLKPGLSSYVDDPAAGGQSVVPLIEYAKERIPKEQWSTTPIFLQATAGLRSVRPEDAEEILQAVRDVLQASPFLFSRDWAKIITGTQEGLNGWVATNYLMGYFHGEVADSVGVVEMGGASMQLTYAPSHDVIATAPEGKLQHLNLAGRRHVVYSHSYLDYGLEAAQEVFQQAFIDEIEEEGNPCYPSGLRHSAKGDFEKCFQYLDKMLEMNDNCEYSTCSFNGVYQPVLGDSPFVAIENFYYTTDFFDVDDSPRFVEDLRAKGKEYCATPWEEISQKYPDEGKSDLQKYCFATSYLTAVLEEGFGFTNPDKTIRISRNINGMSIDWALGAVLLELMSPNGPAAMGAVAVPQDFVGSPGTGLAVFLLAGALIGAGVHYKRKMDQKQASTKFPRRFGNMV